MKLSDYAKLNSISYRTAWRHFVNGLIPHAKQLSSGTIVVSDAVQAELESTAVYCRVSSSENKVNLDTQADRVCGFCAASGWVVTTVVKEVGSGMNDTRPKLVKLLTNPPTRIVVEHKDRLTRFGFNYLETLLNKLGCRVVVINEATNDKDDLMQDFVAVVTSFCARLYGQRRNKRKTIKLIEQLSHADTE